MTQNTTQHMCTTCWHLAVPLWRFLGILSSSEWWKIDRSRFRYEMSLRNRRSVTVVILSYALSQMRRVAARCDRAMILLFDRRTTNWVPGCDVSLRSSPSTSLQIRWYKSRFIVVALRTVVIKDCAVQNSMTLLLSSEMDRCIWIVLIEWKPIPLETDFKVTKASRTVIRDSRLDGQLDKQFIHLDLLY